MVGGGGKVRGGGRSFSAGTEVSSFLHITTNIHQFHFQWGSHRYLNAQSYFWAFHLQFILIMV
jgi:hypothetical protein